MGIPSTNQYVGGKFVIVDNTGSRNITGITITESGTVDGLNDLDNIKLFYELDTSPPYDGASESYGGGESQFGSTDTTGFSAANGTSSFTGSVAISTTATMVVYVVFDVGSGATDGETVEISIADPSTEVTVSTGTVAPDTEVAMIGTTELKDPTLTLADHGSQVTDKFTTTSPVTDTLFHFELTRLGTVSVTEVRVQFTGTGIVDGDVSSGELWEDTNGNGTYDGGPGDTLLAGGVSPASGVLTFTATFSPGTGGTAYFMRATVGSLAANDDAKFNLGIADIDSGGVAEEGTISQAQHTQDPSDGVTLANATGWQTSNQFTSASFVVDAVLFKFRLTRNGTATVDTLDVNFTTGDIPSGDVTQGELWADDGDGVWESGQDTLIQGGRTGSGGALSFTTDFTPDLTGTNYFIVADVVNLASPDTTTFYMNTTDITLLVAGSKSGSVSNAIHTALPCTGWWDCDWGARRQITFQNSARSGSLTDFPVLICLTSSEVDYSKTQNSGQDLRFVDSNDSTLLDHEIEYWNESGTSYVWVKIPQLDATDTDFIYMYYDNSGASAPSAASEEATWSNSFESVYHLHNSNFADASGIKSAASNNGTANQNAGVAAGARTFDGSNDYINTNWTPDYSSSQDFTWEGWFRTDNTIQGTDDIMGIEDRFLGAGDDSEIRFAIREGDTGSGNPVDQWDVLLWTNSAKTYSNSSALTPSTNVWHHAVLVRDGSTARTYLDGTQVHFGPVNTGALTFPTRAPWTTTNRLLIGAQWNTDSSDAGTRNWYEGELDE